MKETDLAWAAGFIDGEGTVVVVHRKDDDSFGLRLVVSQTVERPLQTLKDMFGGSVYQRKDNRKESYKTLWTWQAAGQTAQETLKAIYPFLQVKSHQAAIALVYPFAKRQRDAESGTFKRHPLARILQELCRNALHDANDASGRWKVQWSKS